AIGTLQKAIQMAPDRNDLRLKVAGLEKKRAMWLKAAEQYKTVLDADPDNNEARLAYAELLLADYQFATAESNFRLLLGRDLTHPEADRAKIGLGTVLYATRRYPDAVKIFSEMIQEHPGDPTSMAYRNFALRKMGDLEGAIRGWTELVSLRPDIKRGQFIRDELQELRADIVQQRQKVAAHPDDTDGWRVLGDLLMEQPDVRGAIDAYSRAAGLAPDEVRIRMRLGEAMREGGRTKAAAGLFRSLITDKEMASLASYNLAWCERRIAGPAEEAEAWRAAVNANPRDAYAYRMFLDALARSDQTERELGLLLGAIKDRPLDPLPRIQYGVLAESLGRRVEAARAFLDALSLEPNDPWAQGELARVIGNDTRLEATLRKEIDSATTKKGADASVTLYRRAALSLAGGRPDECAAMLSKRIAAEKGDAKAAVALAACQRASGRTPGETLDILKAARDAAPEYEYAHLDLAMALSSVGRFHEAADEAQAALGLNGDDVYALTALGVAMRELGGDKNLQKSFATLGRSLELSPMDPTGVARLMQAKVAWQLGRERDARHILVADIPVEPEELYAMTWEFVRDNYRDRTFNGQDWSVWKDRYKGKLETEEDALGAIALMLASLDDRDTRIRSADQTAAYMFSRRGREVDRDSAGRATASSRSVQANTLDENVGYVAVTNMQDPKLATQVSKAFDEMSKRDGVILDLRGNLGGSERDAQAITEMLVKPGTKTGTVITPKGKTPIVNRGEDKPKLPEKPLVVLVDRHTASSAEALAGALKESKRAVIVGEDTYGKAGIQMPRLLPGGTMVLLATAETGDLSGVSYAGRGIEPDVSLDSGLPDDADPAHDAALQKAREILRKKRMEQGGANSKESRAQ
ncbi:MAG TPA: S41 family peptidase, partial [Candidatus Saccharimonadales bacterium]|nr:S41 family peptidase [Candidatus Saccharimonadales bacterium]